MYDYARLVLKNEIERLKHEQSQCANRCSDSKTGLEGKLLSINTYQNSIFDLEDAIGILEDIAKDIENDKSNGES